MKEYMYADKASIAGLTMSDKGPTFDRAIEVDFKEKKLIVVQCHNNKPAIYAEYVLVPGFRASKNYKKRGRVFVKVEPVLPEDHKAVENILKNKFQGHVNFW